MNTQHKFKGLQTVIYKVSDLERAKTWYTEAFQTVPYFDEPFYVGYDIAGYELGLQPEEGIPVKGNNIEAYWGVEDIEASFARLIALGGTAISAPANVGGPIMVAIVKDPWDNLLGIIYNPLFGKNPGH